MEVDGGRSGGYRKAAFDGMKTTVELVKRENIINNESSDILYG